MVDIVDKKTRSKMMSGIKSINTKPEMLIRKALFAKGFRYRLHDKKLPGKPDLVFPKYKAVIFVHGCFWHGHDCHLFKWPSSNEEFWKTKINRNKEVDVLNRTKLLSMEWRVLEIWECTLKGKNRIDFEFVISSVSNCLKNETTRYNVYSGRDVAT